MFIFASRCVLLNVEIFSSKRLTSRYTTPTQPLSISLSTVLFYLFHDKQLSFTAATTAAGHHHVSIGALSSFLSSSLLHYAIFWLRFNYFHIILISSSSHASDFFPASLSSSSSRFVDSAGKFHCCCHYWNGNNPFALGHRCPWSSSSSHHRRRRPAR